MMPRPPGISVWLSALASVWLSASAQECDLGGMMAQSAVVTATCCGADGSACGSSAVPTSCDHACGDVFIPFWDSCGSLLLSLGMPGSDEFGFFASQCEDALVPPGACGESCTAETLECRMDEVREACCVEDHDCDAQNIPANCGIDCARILPKVYDDCAEVLRSGATGAHEWQRRWPQMGRTYDKCFDQDPTEALDLLYDLLYLQHCDVALVRPAALRSSACPDTKPCWHTGGRGRGSWRRDLAE